MIFARQAGRQKGLTAEADKTKPMQFLFADRSFYEQSHSVAALGAFLAISSSLQCRWAFADVPFLSAPCRARLGCFVSLYAAPIVQYIGFAFSPRPRPPQTLSKRSR